MTQPIQLFDAASSTFTYVLVCEETHNAVIIDPVDSQLERDLALLRDKKLTLIYTIETQER